MTTPPDLLAAAIEHYQAGRLAEADELCRRYLAADPANPRALYLAGSIALRSGEYDSAIDRFTKILALHPNLPQVYNDLGSAQLATGNRQQAKEHYFAALALDPKFAESQYNLANVFKEEGKWTEAISAFRTALELKPDFPEACNNLADALQHAGQLDEAIDWYRKAIELRPNFADAVYNLGNAFRDRNELDQAILCYRRTLDIAPHYTAALNNLALILQEQDNLSEAVPLYRMALSIKPDYVDAWNNLGNTLKDLGDFGPAMDCYRKALSLDPESAHAHLNHSSLSLQLGHFEQGFAEYAWRWKTGRLRFHDFPQPRWNGEPLNGKSILLWSEQGLGDTIQFVRYVQMVKSLGATVHLQVQRPLLHLLRGLHNVDSLIGNGDPTPVFDYHCPLLSLPRVFGTTVSSIPAPIPYLRATESLAEHWRAKLNGLPAMRIGSTGMGEPAKEIFEGATFRSMNSQNWLGYPLSRSYPCKRMANTNSRSHLILQPSSDWATKLIR